ncbi:Uncharacterised protein [Mycobacteroides abscessus subsp. massiliense]|uniref:helix-turn-helix domain-containing protein n=1 Tax=Mycobacteroides abscessus TaxID=36809 RepID=UPI0009A73479|nr:helix-turn-helix domain-containing protein [Mycobacteroides abscessus]NOR99683.1 helix-turn-helix domain-containing protein [Mycobacteroides abscessus]SKG48531.1 Uncharacterised protein [Mycobacteroides abscessus subsp. massiliense]SKG99919.1 Uncharacterised protein [Mycobacteroides abscessus subsp. massiliense]SKH98173.1 Uncharacterised protein [Mycobacteroides abscessus subsp. massiliense]SKJ27592.1 Uncharacterised protein [Mycobacteroides abscessus subsp. massiliense]
MNNRSKFQFAVANPAARREIALAAASGIPVEQLAEEFSISPSTVRAYSMEWEEAQRTIRNLDVWERESIVHACHRGGRRRWEQELGPAVVRELLGEG